MSEKFNSHKLCKCLYLIQDKNKNKKDDSWRNKINLFLLNEK